MTTTEALNIEPQGLTRVAQELLDNSGFLLARLGFAAKARALEEFDRLGYAAYHYGVPALLGQDDLDPVAGGIEEAEPESGKELYARLLERASHRLLVVDDEAEVTSPVGRLR